MPQQLGADRDLADPNPTRFHKTLGLNDFYFGADDYPLPLGHIQMLGKTDATMFQDEAHHLLPGLAADKLAAHALDFWLTSEDLPDPDNRVLVDRDGGIRLHYRPNNLEPHQVLTRKLRHLLNHIGCEPHLLPQHAYFGKSCRSPALVTRTARSGSGMTRNRRCSIRTAGRTKSTIFTSSTPASSRRARR